jgi:dihydroorotase
MPLMLTQVNLQRATLMDYVKWSAVAPAKAWGLYGTKGVIATGAHADIAFVDMAKTGTLSQGRLQTISKISPWHGRAVQGYPVHTLLRGRFVMQHGKLVEEAITHGRSVKGIQAMPTPQPRNQQHYSRAIVTPPAGVRPNALPAEDVPR